MLDTLTTRMKNILNFTSRISRTVRRTTKEAKGEAERFEQETEPALKQGAKQGDVGEIKRRVDEALEELFEKGELALLDDEQKILTVQLRFQEEMEDISNEIKHLRVHARKKAPDDRELLEAVDQAEKLVGRMHAHIIDDEKQEYGSVLEQEKEEHRIMNDAWTPMALAKAMDSVFQLRKERRAIQHDVDDVEGSIKRIDHLLDVIKKDPDEAGELEKEEKSFQEVVKELVQLIEHVWDDFVLIIRVLVQWVYLFEKDEERLEEFFEELGKSGFPKSTLEELEAREQKLEKESDDQKTVALHIVQRTATKEQQQA